MNVAESWPVFDTICLCNTFYGSETRELGWFNTFQQFSENETHSFYKSRTIGSIGQQYTNKNTVDTMDFAYHAYSFGVSFWAPGVRTLGKLEAGELTFRDNGSAHWWETELPSHCAIQLKVQQDIVAEIPAMMASPGYGPAGSGASFAHDDILGVVAPVNAVNPPVMNMAVSQGVPDLRNRFRFPKTIKIPRTATIEAILTVSDVARGVLSAFGDNTVEGPQNYIFVDSVADAVPTYSEFPSRYGITVSLLGKRVVQQRGQYHS